jgi:hypothetical protein
MTRPWFTLALGALVLLPPGAAAAQDNDVMVYTTVGDRPRIGVVVEMNAGAANNKLGATVQSVTPGGPAAKAGLEAGDIITRFNGTSLAGAASDDAGQSGPGQKLVKLAQALSPGDSVKVDYRRGTTSKSTTIVAADLGGAAWSMRTDAGAPMTFDLQPMIRDRQMARLDMERSMEDMGRQFHFEFDRGGLGLDLAEMNAGLGEYFGTAKGVLVLDNPSDSTMPLKAGDVILGIDGREPAGVGQAERILASYDSGDVAKFEIMRMKKKVTLSWTVPASHRMKMPGNMMWRMSAPPGPPPSPGAAPRVKVRVVPSGPAQPAAAPAAPRPLLPART